jgi:hypothetical protein
MTTSRGTRLIALTLAAALLPVREAPAWPVSLMESLARDAQRLVPKTLVRLMQEREKEIFAATQAFPPELSQAMARDLTSGQLQPATIAQLEAHTAEALLLIKQQRVSEGIVAMGALLRIPADLSDPVLSVGPQGYPPGVTQEYYKFVSASLPRIPVVREDSKALTLNRRALPGYWQATLDRSRSDSAVIGIELFQRGRLIDHRQIDYRNPVFGVASLAYSRAVNAIAATWLALWREARGDVTRMPKPVLVKPVNAPPVPATPVASPASPGGHTP